MDYEISGKQCFDLTLIYQLITVGFLLICSSLYFLEKKNKFATYFYLRLEIINKKKVNQSFCTDLGKVFSSASDAKEELFYLVHILFFTFVAFPGIVLSMQFTFLDNKKGWKTITLVTLHNVTDTIGRIMG
jgi:hypothetical protein